MYYVTNKQQMPNLFKLLAYTMGTFAAPGAGAAIAIKVGALALAQYSLVTASLMIAAPVVVGAALGGLMSYRTLDALDS